MSERVVLRCDSCKLEVSRRASASRICWDCGDPMVLIREEAIEVSGPKFVAPRPAEPARDLGPVDPKDWPFWAWSLKWLRRQGDSGVGDTAQRIAAKLGGEAYKKLSQRLGMPCGCSSRQADWNIKYNYSTKE